MRQNQSQHTDAREAVKRAVQGMRVETADIQQQAQDLRQTLADEANDDRPRLWVLPEDTPGHDKSGVMKDAVQEACPGYLVQVAVDAADGGVDKENVNAALLGATPGGGDSDDESGDDESADDTDTTFRTEDGAALDTCPATPAHQHRWEPVSATPANTGRFVDLLERCEACGHYRRDGAGQLLGVVGEHDD